MDKQKIKQLAEEFEEIACKYSADTDVGKLLGALNEVLLKAKAGSIDHILDYVPGDYHFEELGLVKYSDLETAFAKLKLALIFEEDQHKDLMAWTREREKELREE